MSFASFPIDTLGLKQQHVNACARGESRPLGITSRDLPRYLFPYPLLDELTAAGLVTAADVLLAAPADLAKKLRNYSGVPVQIPDLVQAVAQAISPQVHSVSSLISSSESEESTVPNFISTGDAALDAMLGGGVRVGTITDIAGERCVVTTSRADESAAGKSHLTLSLAVAAQLPPPPLPQQDEGGEAVASTSAAYGAGGGTIILTSERVLTTTRLVELAEGMSARVDNPPPIDEILDNVHTSRVIDIDALEHALTFAVPPMLAARRPETYSPMLGQRTGARNRQAVPDEPPLRRRQRGLKPIRLLIIDSITALLRGETERSSTSLTQRSRYLCTIGDRLKALAVEYELAVVVVNQVKDVFAPGFGVGLPVTSGLPGVTTLNGVEGVTSLPGVSAMKLNGGAPPSSQASSVEATALPPMLYATQARHFSGQSPGVAKEAALGIVWANTVNTRLMLARTGRRRVVTDDDLLGIKRARTAPPPPQQHVQPAQLPHAPPLAPDAHVQADTDRSEEKELVRRFHLVFSPFAPPATLDYVILPDGIRTLPASLRLVDLGPAIRRRDLRLRAALEDEGQVFPGPAPQPVAAEEDGPGAHLGSDVYDEMDIPPELWEGLDDAELGEMPGSPLAAGVVD